MRRIVLCCAAVLAGVAGCRTVEREAGEAGAIVFSYFMGNGEDGLHLAYSRDGLTFHTLNGGRSLLTPQVGGDKLMRDPCICRGPDGTFHMVWTVSWKEKGRKARSYV